MKIKNLELKICENKAFTLIELIVVIAIISVLSSLLMANFVGFRARGRDAQRKSDLRQIQAALEMYRADAGTYPTLPSCGSSLVSGSVTYMQKVPCDPSGGSYYYVAGSSAYVYCLRTCLENGSDSERDAVKLGSNNPSITNCTTLTTCTASGRTTSYSLQNP